MSHEKGIIYRKKIGEGSYGEVWSAEWNGSQVAAKRLHKEIFKSEYGQEVIDHFTGELRKEWKILRDLDHPNIVKMHTAFFPPNKSPVIVMELMHCDLRKCIEKSESIPKILPRKVVSISLGVAEGLEYLHGLKPPVVHRDLATKNILLTMDGQPKIADLGVAKVFAAGKEAFATVGPGTPVYSAPETYLNVRDNRAKYGVKVDIFSFGVVLLVIIVGHEPVLLPPNPMSENGSKIPEITRRENDNKVNDYQLKQVVLACLQDECYTRPHAHQIVTQLKAVKKKQTENAKPSARYIPGIHFERISPPEELDYSFKVVLLGSSAVGKTCLSELLRNPTFDISSTTSTIVISEGFLSYRYSLSNIRIYISDTAGQERFSSIPPMYLRKANGVLLVYDVSDHETFEKLSFWMKMIRDFTPENCKVLLVGNKVDLTNSNRPTKPMVTQENALAFANDLGIPYVETSAKDIESIMNMFQIMVDMLMSSGVKADDPLQKTETAPTSTHSSSFPPEQKKVAEQQTCPCNII